MIFKENYKKIIAIWLIVSFMPIGTVDLTVKTAYMKDADAYSFEIDEVSKETIFPINNGISLDATGDFFETAIRIPMKDAVPYRRGSINVELNNSYPFLFFKFNINETSGVRIVINNTEYINFNQFVINTETYNPMWEPIEYLDTYMMPMPFETFFPVQETGDYFVTVGFYDEFDYETVGDTVNLNITIEHFKPGEAREGEISEIIQSDAYKRIVETQQYLIDAGYINYTDNTVNLAELDENDPDFAKGIGLSIYSLLKSAEYIANAGSPDQQQIDSIMTKYANIAYQLMQTINTTMLEPISNLFYYRPSESGNGDYVAYLSDNVYVQVALGELYWMAETYILDKSNLMFIPQNIQTQMLNLNKRIRDMFIYNNEYVEVIKISNYSEDGDSSLFNSNDYSSIQLSNYVSLDSLVLMAESNYWAGETVNMDSIVSFIDSNMKVTNISGLTLSAAGIYISDVYNDEVLIDFAKLDDGGVFTDYTAEAKDLINNDVQLLPASPAINDAFYFGKLSRFKAIIIEGGTNSTGSSLIWEYWDGSAYQSLVVRDASQSFSIVNDIISFDAPIDWQQNTVDGQQAYWVRARVSVAGGQALASRIQLRDVLYTQVNTANLLDNALYISHLNTYAKENYAPNSIASDIRLTLEFASDIAENMLSVFRADNAIDNLLYSSVDIIAASEKLITAMDNAMAIFALNRLALNWGVIAPLGSGSTIVRTWKIRSINSLTAINNLLFDQSTNKYFAQYDDETNKYNIDDNIIAQNQVVANLVMAAPISDAFPVQLASITQRDLSVFSEGQLTIGLSQVITTGTWIFFDPFKPFSVDAKITISEFDYQETLNIDLLSNFGANDVILLNFFYPVEKRGSYNIKIDLSLEGNILLSETIELRALGRPFTEITESDLVFKTTDDKFTGTFSVFDEIGLPLSSLRLEGALGQEIEESITDHGQKYISSARSDSSGKVSITYDVKDLIKDGLIDNDTINSLDGTFDFIDTFMYLNITNADSFDLQTTTFRIPVRIKWMYAFMRISPTNLEMTQGTTDSFTFTVTALNQEQDPIRNARITYSVLEIASISNEVFTDNDGEATITLRDADLFALSNLALRNNILNDGDLQRSTAVLLFNMTHSDYQDKGIARVLNIIPNNLKIIANPVQSVVKERNALQSEIAPIQIEVSVEDLFSRVVPAYVNLEWANDSSFANQFTDLSTIGTHVSPYTFNLDPSNLPAGEYTLLVIAQKEGITSTVEIITTTEGIGLSQLELSIPVVVPRTIIVETSTTQDVLITASSIFIALMIAQSGNIFSFAMKKIKTKSEVAKE